MSDRKRLLERLAAEWRSASSLAREFGIPRGDIEDELRHLFASARAAGRVVEVLPARCKSCDFVFDTERLTKPSRCPQCKGSRLVEALMRMSGPGVANV